MKANKSYLIQPNRIIQKGGVRSSILFADKRTSHLSQQKMISSFKSSKNNPMQCYSEIQSDANGTNSMVAAGAHAGLFANWQLAVTGGIPALKHGVASIYNLMRQRRTGIGPGSCNAVAEYYSPFTRILYRCSGNSYGQQATVHAERQAIQNVLNWAALVDSISTNTPQMAHPANICRIYVELSPCPACQGFLPGIVPNATILYDFDYRTEIALWQRFKSDESKKDSDGHHQKIEHERGNSTWNDVFMNV